MRKVRVKRHAVTQPLDKPYRLIPLTRNQNAIVDVEDFAWLSQWNWCASFYKRRGVFNAVRRAELPNGKAYLLAMHRVILGCKPGEDGDHRNHDTLDNRRENLRKCTRTQNNMNMKKRRNSTGYKRVYFDASRGLWRTGISVNRKDKFIGRFATKEEAARAYDQAAKKFYGEFAYLNFPTQ